MGTANLALIQVTHGHNDNINPYYHQVQGIVVGGLASLIAMLMAWTGDTNKADVSRALVLAASSVITASAASFILGLVMFWLIGHLVIFICYRYCDGGCDCCIKKIQRQP